MTDDLVKRLREVKDWWREPGRTAEQAADRIEQLEAALRSLIDLNDNHSPFGGELYWDRVERIWHNARAALEGK